MKSERTMRRLTMIGIACILLAFAARPFLPWLYNSSASLPLGYYWRGNKQVEKWSLVAFCLPKDVAVYAKARGYIGFGLCPGWTEMLMKQVVATEGDVVEVKSGGVWINGHIMFGT